MLDLKLGIVGCRVLGCGLRFGHFHSLDKLIIDTVAIRLVNEDGGVHVLRCNLFIFRIICDIRNRFGAYSRLDSLAFICNRFEDLGCAGHIRISIDNVLALFFTSGNIIDRKLNSCTGLDGIESINCFVRNRTIVRDIT